MKACIILINWVLSFMGLCIDTEHSPLWAVFVAIGWFALSSWLMIRADRRRWMDKIVKRYKMDEL
jgi:threonine/homoserine/homoserine lactone efflux protein